MKKTKTVVLDYIKKNKEAKSTDLAKKLKLSRQMTTRHLSSLTKEGLLLKEGSTKNAAYYLANSTRKRKNLKPIQQIKITKNLANLQEDSVFNEVSLRLGLKKRLSEGVYSIFNYSFTELLNNAIDHSKATRVMINVQIKNNILEFSIAESGIGVFFNVMRSFRLQTEFEALEHLIKGKQTTLPKHHSGQGLFFTSRIADTFILRSHKIELKVDNTLDDLFAKEERWIKGTTVTFQIKTGSRKKIKDLFDKYANKDDYEFDRADYRIKLLSERSLLSRSQAKRILVGLNLYKKITFDFDKVKEIGQSFTDEIFRVFASMNPNTEVLFINANEVVTGMILRCLRDRKKLNP